MIKPHKLLDRILQGHYENVSFSDFLKLAKAFGFELRRVSGSHHILKNYQTKVSIPVQPRADNQAKSYQVKQLFDKIKEYKIIMKE